MGMDRNTVIGFILIGILLTAMLFMNSRGKDAMLAEKKRIEDSTAKATPRVDPKVAILDSLKADSLKDAGIKAKVGFTLAATEELTVLENEVVKIAFSNKGAQPKEVELKSYKTFDGKPLLIQKGNYNSLGYEALVAPNTVVKTNELLFVNAGKKLNPDGSQSISYTLKDSAGRELTHQYTLAKNDYMVNLAIIANGASQMFTNGIINLHWNTELPQLEKTLSYERQQTFINYKDNEGKFDFTRLGAEGSDEAFEGGIHWLATSAQFFVAGIHNKNKFGTSTIKWSLPADSLGQVAQTSALLKIAASSNNINVPLQLYYGPNDYNVLNKYDNGMEQIVPYGSGPFSFVKYINRHMLLPIWDFLRKHVANYGIIILLLTLIIRLITSPILYKSYVSGAKMKALKPELDALRERHKDKQTGELDQAAFGAAQMQLTRSAGVNMLGGCLPALLQIPIFMSLYFFFQGNIDLRGQNFLWAKDLAAYDSIAHLPFNIPFYGDHVSLFTLTATLTSLLISLYGMSNMQDQSNPVMKYMPYIFPVLLLGVFNNLPAALTWYYTVSNTITLVLQIVIQKFIISPEKIRAEIAENMKKPPKPNKFAERMAAMQEQQRKMKDQQKKNS